MLVSSLSFSIMQVFVKLSSEEVGTFEQTFFRNLVSLIIAAVMVRRENLQVFQEIKRGGWALWGRSFFGFLGIVLFFYAAGHARQADVAMLNRASPVFPEGEDHSRQDRLNDPVSCGRIYRHAAVLRLQPVPASGGFAGSGGIRHGLHHVVLL